MTVSAVPMLFIDSVMRYQKYPDAFGVGSVNVEHEYEKAWWRGVLKRTQDAYDSADPKASKPDSLRNAFEQYNQTYGARKPLNFQENEAHGGASTEGNVNAAHSANGGSTILGSALSSVKNWTLPSGQGTAESSHGSNTA
ncbi:uncharacterized protein I303_104999 [Kwoniella dejecticola CBS 10117]|uniref:Uncharacterized protein n=1 Tax=Kwoniella dejecticola CBS 10117 TaxID=1296121 RepID=A0A1A6A3R4_9TREE|nr:uncharacterized protein I303_05557 [Kwoniella dejecticola CBS 10117]OBR84698.1 hypothetical protein I303_05557 [Kwoniella dejecticola CBS 10117]